jgi:hypothetical protein
LTVSLANGPYDFILYLHSSIILFMFAPFVPITLLAT